MVGQKMGSLKKLKASLKSGAIGPIRYIPKNGSLTVRFLEEPENWVNYQEHWDQIRKTSYPCIETGCPGCAGEERKSSRYLANALNVDDDKVIALQLPKDLTNNLVRKYERYDTLMDRDYTLSRDGEGLETTYDADAEPVLPRKLTKYVLLNLEEVLDDVVASVLGISSNGDDDDDPAPVKQAVKKRPPAAETAKKQFSKPPSRVTVVEDVEVDDDEDEDEEVEDDDGPDVNDLVRQQEEAEDDEDDEEELTESDLRSMTLGALRRLAKEENWDVTGLTKDQIVDALLGADDDDEDDEDDD